jgi:hypothetical protein
VESDVHFYAAVYRLAHEWRSPMQLDQYEAVIEWLPGGGARREA